MKELVNHYDSLVKKIKYFIKEKYNEAALESSEKSDN